ncbi:MAG: aspartyl-tRNA(Asn)/glutamyl-tRNA(Gln) amidotransferase subunit [Frankiales bacterium]|nr:aspartyl-tRNA(Asn)/glutamyl-tRNA(Gln) amidotransferase subunit [Frankiales bacterium]
MTDPAGLSLVELLGLLQSRELSAVELVEACLARVQTDEAEVRAFATFTPESAVRAAQRADALRAQGRDVGVLAGVPIAVKDLYLTADAPTHAGSRVALSYDPGADSAAWERLAAAGAGLMGKTTTHEFGMGTASPPTRNPWDLKRTSGGSSGGSAAAVAARMVPAAVGSDTGGSLRIPAAVCGVATLRPAHGRVSTYGLLPLSPSLDVAGPIARRLLDVSLLMRVLVGHDRRDPASFSGPVPGYPIAARTALDGVRIGVAQELSWSGVDESISSVCQAALHSMVDRGAQLIEIDPLAGSAELHAGFLDVFEVLTGTEALHEHGELLHQRHAYTPQVLRRVLEGQGITAAAYLKAVQLRQGWTALWHQIFAEHQLDVVAHPAIDQPAPTVDPTQEPVGPRIRLSVPWSLAGFPAVNVPVGLDRRGLPVGLSLAGQPENEPALLAIGCALDEAIAFWASAP